MSTAMGLLLFTAFFIAAASAYEKDYYGYQLIEVTASTKRDQEAIIYLQSLDPELDFWYLGPEYVHVFVGPEKLEDFTNYVERNGMKYKVINDHVQRDIEEEEEALRKRAGSSKVFNVDDYNTYEDIVAELDNLAGRCRADLGVICETYSIGQTYEGRDLKVLRIYKNGAGRKGIWIDASTHAREWLGTATQLKITTHLVDDYPTDPEVQSLVDTYDFYLLPVLNADGYAYTWTGDRLWRKNRSPNAGSSCLGTDLNRNFEEEWGNAGTSIAACSETYGGAYAASELETQAVQSEARRLGPTLHTSVHLHTYGQYWLIPWGAYAADGRTCKIATDDAEMMLVHDPAADAVENTYGTTWLRGNSCATIYPASGLTMDYFKAFGGVKYPVTPECRGNSFVAATSQIELSFQEVWNGVTTAISLIPA